MRRALAALAASVALAGCSSAPEPEARAQAEPSSTPSAQGVDRTVTEPAPEEWRTEVWRDVQLEVPERWALGYAPMARRDGALSCGVGPLEGERRARGPYVGRPGYGSDVCLRQGLDDLGLDRAGVWFGSPLPEGEVLSKTGLRQVTVEVGGSRVTVASKEDTILERIVGSAEQVREDGNGCPERPRVERGYPDEGYGEAQSLAVCVYERRGGWNRLWTDSLPAGRAELLVEAVEDAEAGPPCRGRDSGQIVLLRVAADDPMGDGPSTRDLVARPSGCSSLRHWGPGGEWLRLTPELVRPWAVTGVRTYVYSNGLPRPVADLFRPLWG